MDPQFKVRHVHNFVEESDVVIWLGDLNYRLEMPRASVGFLISHNLEEVISQLICREHHEVYPTLKLRIKNTVFSLLSLFEWLDV